MKVFVVAEQVGKLWRIKDTTLIALTETSKGNDDEGQQSSPDDLLTWATFCWNAEVANRPLRNIHRRALDDTWQQVIRFAGGDPIALLGPSHDDLLGTLIENRKISHDHHISEVNHWLRVTLSIPE